MPTLALGQWFYKTVANAYFFLLGDGEKNTLDLWELPTFKDIPPTTSKLGVCDGLSVLIRKPRITTGPQACFGREA